MANTFDNAALTPNRPALFEEFFEQGQNESISPFLSPKARKWGASLAVKSAIASALLLIAAFYLSFKAIDLAHFLLVIVYFLAGMRPLIDAVEDICSMNVNIDVLMTLAAFSSVLIGSEFEGALLLVLFSTSEAMEEAVSAKAKNALSQLRKIAPAYALIVQKDGHTIEKAVADIEVGQYILIRSGEIVPLDGIVIEGISSVNLVHLTGESIPVTKAKGDHVAGGAYNMEGVLTLEVVHSSNESTLSKIIQLVTEAQEAKPQLQQWFDKLSKTYALSIISLTAFFSLTLPFLLGIPFLGIEGSVYRSLAFLIAASPCALILAIPIAYLSAIGICAKRGILVKGGVTLDILAGCNAIAFDKTGTLTTGELTCLGFTSILNPDLLNEQQIVSLACVLERAAVHPIARAIMNYGKKYHISNIDTKELKVLPGMGVVAEVSISTAFKNAFIGNVEYLLGELKGIKEKVLQEMLQCQKNGELVALMQYGEAIFLFRFTDQLRPNIKQTINILKNKNKLKLTMLTGDHAANAKRVAEEVGLENWHAELSPADKLHLVGELAKKEKLIMIGDGINDAPALARANVGICMGKVGSTAAVEAADVVLLHDNIELVSWLLDKAHKTTTIVKQNLALATAAILLASLPALAGLVPLWLAVVMHEGGTVLVGVNALRLLRK